MTKVCPRCLEEQPQRYGRAVLHGCLQREEAIEAYGVECDELWDLSPRERAQLARALSCSSVVLHEP
jgi:hypothetical protein